jgi:hypothetical protein
MMKQAGFTQKLLMAFVITQLATYGGAVSSEPSSKSKSKRVPDEYRVSPSSKTKVNRKSSADTDADMTGVAATGNMDLSWTAPVTRSDGTPLSLSDINGYRIYYGASAGNYTESVEIADGSALSATVTDIPAGIYHVVMSTYDVDGRESSYSSSVIKTIQ